MGMILNVNQTTYSHWYQVTSAQVLLHLQQFPAMDLKQMKTKFNDIKDLDLSTHNYNHIPEEVYSMVHLESINIMGHGFKYSCF